MHVRARCPLQLGRSELAPPLCRVDLIRNQDDASPHRRLDLARTASIRDALDSLSNVHELGAGPSCRS
jgi:hypothetical protein